MINAVEFSPEELDKKNTYKSGNIKQKPKQPPPSRNSGPSFDDCEDDIPF
jgi:hypothetical protein